MNIEMPSPKNKILFVHYSDVRMTGGERMTLRLVTGMRNSEFVPLFVTQRYGPLAVALKTAGIATIILPLPKLLDRYDGAILRYSGLRKCRAAAQWLAYNATFARLLRREGISALWCSNIRALLTVGLIARALQIPVIWNIWLARRFRTHTRLIYGLGYALASRIVTEYRGQPREVFPSRSRDSTSIKISTVYTGIDDSFFGLRRSSDPAVATQATGACEILTCCRITPRKDLGCFLESVRILADRGVEFRATIVGSPFTEGDRVYYRELLDSIRKNGLAAWVRFVEWSDTVQPLLAQAAIYVSSSLAEGLPGAIREAQAAGVPVVATDAGGTREAVLDGVTGFVVPCHDALALADAIQRLSTNRQLADEFGRAARKHAAQLFTTTRFIHDYRKVFQNVLQLHGDDAA